MIYLLALALASTPLYVARFSLAGLPLNFLEIAIFVFLAAFILELVINRSWKDYIAFMKSFSRPFLISTALFIVAGFISMLISPDKARGVGLFVVLFLQPIATFFPAAYLFRKEENKNKIITLLFFLVGIFSIYGIIQYFTLAGLPPEWWGNSEEPKRIISVFAHPNFLSLFIAPILAYLLPFIFRKDSIPTWFKYLCYILGLIALLLSLSRGGWFGFAAAILAYLLFFGNKRIKTSIAVAFAIVVIAIAAVPNLRYRVLLPFQGEKSSVSRLSIWETGAKMIKDSPILGKGLYGYKSNFDKYNTDKNLNNVNQAHNLFLNLWVETGILGLLSFVFILILSFLYATRKKTVYSIGLILFLITFFVHGLIDGPYMKNDLALVFWVVLATL